MAQRIDRQTRDRIEEDLNLWDAIEQTQIRRYGRDILKDPGFISAKRDMFKRIQEKYRRTPANPQERASLRVLRSQRRAMLRRMYPNPYIRLIRNLMGLGLSALWLLSRMSWAAVTAPFRVLIGQLGPGKTKTTNDTGDTGPKLTNPNRDPDSDSDLSYPQSKRARRNKTHIRASESIQNKQASQGKEQARPLARKTLPRTRIVLNSASTQRLK